MVGIIAPFYLRSHTVLVCWRALGEHFGEVCELFSNDRLPLKSHFDWKKRVIYAQAENSWRIIKKLEKRGGGK